MGIFLIFCFYKLNYNNSKFIFATLAITLILFSSFRYDVGVDYLMYYELVSNYSNEYTTDLDHIYNFELAHGSIINSLFFIFKNRFIVFCIYIFLIAAFTITCFVVFINQFSDDRYLSLFIFMALPIFYLSSFNAVRMFSAVSLFCVSLKYIKQKNFIKYAFVCMICISLHKVSIIIFPLYFFLNRIITVPQYLFILFAVTLFPFYDTILNYLCTYSGLPLFYFLESENSINYLSVIFFLFSFILIMLFKIKSINITKYNLFLNLLLISQILIILSFHLPIRNDYIFRLTGFFSPAIIILIPAIIYNTRIKQLFFVRKIVIFCCVCYFTYTIIIGGTSNNLVPYDTIFTYLSY